MNGLYIAFEGIVGSGKTTQIKNLTTYLSDICKTAEIIATKEPGGSETADVIRNLVQASNKLSKNITHVCEAYLYASSRAETLRTIVLPAIKANKIVISDRTYLSSLAFQGHGRNLSEQIVLDINKVALIKKPDIVFYLDIDPETGINRSFDSQGDKFEKESVTFFSRVKEGYYQISKSFENEWINIDGRKDVESVFLDIKNRIHKTKSLTKFLKLEKK